jgi:hypothetical protein
MRRHSRITSALAVSAVIAVAGCGSASKNGLEELEDDDRVV